MKQAEGGYRVHFKNPQLGRYDNKCDALYSFDGICENFNPSGTCAFRDDEDQVLIVDYKDIVQMRLIRK